MTDFLTWWQLITASLSLPASATVIAGLWAAWVWYTGRKDSNRNSLANQALQSGGDSRESMKIAFSELRASYDDCEREKDDLVLKLEYALYGRGVWYWRFREQRHVLANAVNIAAGLFERLRFHGKLRDGEELPNWMAAMIKEAEGPKEPPGIDDVPPQPKRVPAE